MLWVPITHSSQFTANSFSLVLRLTPRTHILIEMCLPTIEEKKRGKKTIEEEEERRKRNKTTLIRTPRRVAAPTHNTPALRQAMYGDNPEVHMRYVELSVNRFKNDLPNMEPRAVAHLIRACGRVCSRPREKGGGGGGRVGMWDW
jgi:hypothetical protein